MRMVNDSGKLWIDALSCKQLRHGNATDMQESIFYSIEEHGITQEDIKKRMIGTGSDGAKLYYPRPEI